jgi:hypothetical protein
MPAGADPTCNWHSFLAHLTPCICWLCLHPSLPFYRICSHGLCPVLCEGSTTEGELLQGCVMLLGAILLTLHPQLLLVEQTCNWQQCQLPMVTARTSMPGTTIQPSIALPSMHPVSVHTGAKPDMHRCSEHAAHVASQVQQLYVGPWPARRDPSCLLNIMAGVLPHTRPVTPYALPLGLQAARQGWLRATHSMRACKNSRPNWKCWRSRVRLLYGGSIPCKKVCVSHASLQHIFPVKPLGMERCNLAIMAR